MFETNFCRSAGLVSRPARAALAASSLSISAGAAKGQPVYPAPAVLEMRLFFLAFASSQSSWKTPVKHRRDSVAGGQKQERKLSSSSYSESL
jgi:hypothetical protein